MGFNAKLKTCGQLVSMQLIMFSSDLLLFYSFEFNPHRSSPLHGEKKSISLAREGLLEYRAS